MNKLKTVACVALLSISLGACTTQDWKNAAAKIQDVWDSVNTSINFALGQIPALCNDAYVAHSKFRDAAAVFHFSNKVLTAEAKAAAAVASVCNNPPTTLAEAITDFKPAYKAFRDAQAAAAAEANTQ